MKAKVKNTMLAAIGASVVSGDALAACGSNQRPANVTVEVPSGLSPNVSMSGTVTYRERLALSPGAQLVVELRDVSYAGRRINACRSTDRLRSRAGAHQF